MPRGTPDWGQVAGGQQSVTELPTYTLSLDDSDVVSSGDSALNMLNPAGSGKIVRIRRAIFTAGAFADDTSGLIEIKVHRISANGTGAARTARPFDSDDSASVVEAISEVTVEPTYGVQLGNWVAALLKNDTSGAEMGADSWFLIPIFDYVAGGPGKPLTLRPGEGLAFEVDNNGVDAQLSLTVEFTEEME